MPCASSAARALSPGWSVPHLSTRQGARRGARAGHRRAGQPGGLEGGGNVQRGGAARRGVPPHHPARHGEAMKPILAIARRELVSYFTSPVAYVFLVIFLLLTGFFTFTAGNFFERGEASLAAFFGWHPWLYLVLVPAVGMRLWAEERRSGTMELLLTMPVAPWQAIVAKFLASWIFLAVALAFTFPAVITVNLLGDPDNGVIVAGYLGSLFLAGAYLAITCMTSAMTRNQVVAFILSVVICLFLILAGFNPVTDLLVRWASPAVVDTVAAFSVVTHFDGFQRGVIDSRDLVFFLSVIGFALFATGVIIRGHRAG